MSKRFPIDLADRGVVKITDNLLIHNIDTGVTEYITVQQLLTALRLMGNISINGNLIGISGTYLDIYTNTIDGADTKIFRAGGGGDVSPSRGGFISCYGNEAAPYPGAVILTPGTGKYIYLSGIPEHADNAAALLAGLTAGALYRTVDTIKIVH